MGTSSDAVQRELTPLLGERSDLTFTSTPQVPPSSGGKIGLVNRGGGLHWREFLLALSVGDAVVVALAMFATIQVLDAWWPTYTPTNFFNFWALSTFALWLLALKVGGSYDFLEADGGYRHQTALFQSAGIVSAVTFIGFFLFPFAFPRSIGLATPFFVLAFLFVWRSLVFAQIVHWQLLQRRVLLLGLDETTTRLAAVLRREHRTIPYFPVAFVTDVDSAPSALGGVPVMRGTDKLWEYVNRHSVAEIVVGRWEKLSATCMAELVRCFEANVVAIDARTMYEDLTGRILVGHVGANWYADLPTLPRRGHVAVKRVVDVVVAAALAIIGAPLLALLAVLVLVDDGRPILFRQIRVGRHGAPFTIHKFRSMRRDAEAGGPQYAVPDDSRATRLGLFLRRSGLDELPQLWDVLRGRMSLIGPRPERPEFVAQLVREMPLYRARQLVRPGVVGWAEVHVLHATDVKEHLTRLEYDLYYVKHGSMLMDANIVMRTISMLLRGRRG